MDLLIKLAEAAAKFGEKNIWTAVAVFIVLVVLKVGLSPSKQSKEYQEEMRKQAEQHTNTLKSLNDTLQAISSKMEGWDRNVFEELKHLENKMKNYELILKRNLLQYVRLTFKSIVIDEECVANKAHDKRLCPFPDNVICETIERYKTLVFHELDCYIIDDSVKERIRKILESYIQPSVPIKECILKMLDEVEKAVK